MISYQRLSLDKWNDVKSLFEQSEECRNCWCMNHRLKPESCVTGNAAKNMLHELIGLGQAKGVLAYMDGKCVGWCAVDSLSAQPGHDYCLEKPESVSSSTWSVHCLFVSPKARGMGLSTGLVQEAVALARDEGAKALLAFPIPETTRAKFPEHDAEFSGRLSTYFKAGFTSVEQLNDFYQVVELKL